MKEHDQIYTCWWCGEEFSDNSSMNKFCSQLCNSNWRKGKVPPKEDWSVRVRAGRFSFLATSDCLVLEIPESKI